MSEQLSLFTPEQIEMSPLVYSHYNPGPELTKQFFFEVFYNEVSPWNKTSEFFKMVNHGHISPLEFASWNVLRHRNGKNRVQIGNRFFYD